MAENNFRIELNKFYTGYSPLAFVNDNTETGSAGNASDMQNVDLLSDVLTQGSGISVLTGGNQAGAVTELINFIHDKAMAADVAYAIGNTKLFKISSTAVTNAGIWPHTITNSTQGSSIVDLKGNLYYFFNKASGGDIGKYDLVSTFTDNWGSSVPTGMGALQNAPHPSGTVEDIMAFGNGKYVGVYFNDSNTIDLTKLDFGTGNEVVDIIYSNGYWYIAINSSITGTNRTEGRIFLWDGSGIPTTLSDETGVGVQKLGFLYRINGVVYVAYNDLTNTGFIIGYINGKSITPLKRFNGVLPNFQKKTLFKNTILFLSDNLAFSAGSFVPELPYQLSQIASTRYATSGAVAAPFGTPLVSSTDGGANFSLDKFSGLNVNSFWSSITFPLALGEHKAYVDKIIVLTNTLASGARADLTIEYDQASGTSTAQAIMTTGKRRHVFKNFGLPSGGIEDMLITIDFINGSATNPCSIRGIVVIGHWVENT